MSRCPQCFGPNDDAGYSHFCHACLVTLEPTPQEQKVAPPVDGQSKSAFTPSNGDTPAVVGFDPVAFMTHHDDPMLFPTWDEAVQYCDDDESPISLFHAADVARLQAERDCWLESAKEFCKGMEYYRDQLDAAARHIGLPCFTADDGGVHEEPLRAKVVECVATLQAENKALRKDAERLNYLERLLSWNIKPSDAPKYEGELWLELCSIDGNRNDREYNLRGGGSTIRQAIDAAMKGE